MAETPPSQASGAWPSRAIVTLVALILAHALCTLAYHLMAKYLGVSLGGTGAGQSLLGIVLDPRFWALVVIELGSFALWLLILARIDLGKATLLSALSYCLIMVVGALVFHERVGWQGLTGSAMILGGIALLASAGEGRHDR